MRFEFGTMRFPSIALTAIAFALLLSADAQAGCTSMPEASTCQAVCCCTPAEPSTLGPDGASPLNARPAGNLDSANARPGGCSCRPQAPIAPEPKGPHLEESRSDQGRSSQASSAYAGEVRRAFFSALPLPSSPPQTIPLYLHTSRLLI